MITLRVLSSIGPNVRLNVTNVRMICSLDVTKNLTLLSNEKKNGKITNLKMEIQDDKPLVVLLSWLMAKKKHIYKFADFYISRGFDVLNVSITPWQLLWPVKGTQIIANDILTFLNKNHSSSPILLHGFSVGAYVWSEALVQMASDRTRYDHIADRISGQIWDSAADITEIPEGFSFAVFPNNKVLQTTLKQYLIYHLKTFDKVATCHYIRASQIFHTNFVKAPALFFFSKTDPIGTESSNMRAIESWHNMGIRTTWKCWDRSLHVGHFRKHPEEYKTELARFIDGLESKAYEEHEVLSQIKAKL